MFIAEIWRYPVKSMAGEQVKSARLTQVGIEGDRIIQVRNAHGRTVTSRTHPGLLGFTRRLTSTAIRSSLDGRGTIRKFSPL